MTPDLSDQNFCLVATNLQLFFYFLGDVVFFLNGCTVLTRLHCLDKN